MMKMKKMKTQKVRERKEKDEIGCLEKEAAERKPNGNKTLTLGKEII